jgi:hypothetical protein
MSCLCFLFIVDGGSSMLNLFISLSLSLSLSLSSDIHDEKSQDDDNHKTEKKYLETHFL